MENEITSNILEAENTLLVPTKKQRSANFELLRILCMLMIVAWHFSLHGEWNDNMSGWNLVVDGIFRSIFRPAVNLFVMIGAYFLSSSKNTHVNLKKIGKLWGAVFFYSVVLYITSLFIYDEIRPFNWKELLEAIFPVISGKYWFVSTYIFLLLCAPFLNMIIRGITVKQHVFISAFFLLVGFISTDLHFGFSQLPFSKAYIIWFIGLYFIASLIRRVDFKITKKWAPIAIIAYLVTLFFGYFGKSHTSLCTSVSSIIVFTFFKELKIKDGFVSKAICKISSLTFGVYLIHDSNEMRAYMYQNIFHSYKYYDSDVAVLIEIGFVLVTFVVCLAIEFARQELFNVGNIAIGKIKDKIKIKKDAQDAVITDSNTQNSESAQTFENESANIENVDYNETNTTSETIVNIETVAEQNAIESDELNTAQNTPENGEINGDKNLTHNISENNETSFSQVELNNDDMKTEK